MKKTKYIIATLVACALAFAGCKNGSDDSDELAFIPAEPVLVESGSKKPSMAGGTIDDNGVLTRYEGNAAEVVIPEGVTGIGEYAFSGCEKLRSVTIPASVAMIWDDAFSGCENLTVNYGGTFEQWCAMDNDDTLMDNATAVNVAGKDLKSMETLVIPDGVKRIENYAFSRCKSLESVTIPASIASIVWCAFYGCENLSEVRYGGTLEQWCAMDNDWALMNNATVVNVADTNLKNESTIVIPDGVKRIGNSAFSMCNSLMDVEIPASVTSIGEWTFRGCHNLRGVKIPDSVTSIGLHAFSECGLMSVDIPGSMTSIGDRVFAACGSLANVTIPVGVTSIGNEAFFLCKNLTTVTYKGTKAQWNAIEKGVEWDGDTGNYTIHCSDGDLSK